MIFAYCGILPFFGPLIIVHAFFCCSVQRSSLESPSALENLKRPSARQFWGRQVLVSYKIKTHIVCLLPIETPVVPSKSGKHLAVRPTSYQFRRFHSACFFSASAEGVMRGGPEDFVVLRFLCILANPFCPKWTY